MRRLLSTATTIILVATTGADLALAAGLYAGEVGARGLGRAGADVVSPADGFAMWRNPAALALQTGAIVDVEGMGSLLTLQFTRTGPYATDGYDTTLGGHRVTVGRHQEINPVDVGLPSGDDWRDIFSTENSRSKGTAVNRASPFLVDCSALLGPGFDGQGHCPVPMGSIVLGERAHQVRRLTLALGAFGSPTGGYWFWDESAATAPDNPDASQRYLDSRGLDQRFTGPQRYTLIDREMVEAVFQLSAAYRLKEWLAVGIGLQAIEAGIRMRVAVSADRYGTEDPNMDAVINVRASQSYIPSAIVGLWSNPFAELELGASYQLGRSVQVVGPAVVDYTAPGLEGFDFDAEGSEATIRFDMPDVLRLGARYRFDPWLDLELAYVFERWSVWQVALVEITGVSFTMPGMDEIGVEPVVQPKALQDTHAVRLGSDVDPLAALWPDHLTLRGGVFLETSAVPSRTLDVALIDADKLGVAGGVELRYAGFHLRLAYQHTFMADVTVDDSWATILAPAGDILGYETRTAAANGTYRSSFDIVTIGVGVDVVQVIDETL